MSISQDMWTNYKTAIQGNAALNAFNKTFKFGNKHEQYNPNSLPLIHSSLLGVVDDSIQEIPTTYQQTLNISVSIKISNNNPDTLMDKILEGEELIKNALCADLTLSGSAEILRFTDSEFQYLDNDVLEDNFEVNISSIRYAKQGR